MSVTKQLNIRVPEPDLIRWREQASRERRTVQSLIMVAMDRYLDDSKPQGSKPRRKKEP